MKEQLTLQELEQKIRQSIPELKDEYEAFEDGSIDRDMITPIMLNHVLEYLKTSEFGCGIYYAFDSDGDLVTYEMYPNLIAKLMNSGLTWNLKSAYLKDQSEELINFLNELK